MGSVALFLEGIGGGLEDDDEEGKVLNLGLFVDAMIAFVEEEEDKLFVECVVPLDGTFETLLEVVGL